MSERVLPMLAQINLDGNCFIITLIALMLMFTTGTGISWLDVAIVGLTVFFLSLGAPNQPGSILIGLLVIFSYMNALDFVALAIFSEAILGPLLSVANAAGDIVTIAITEKQQKAPGGASLRGRNHGPCLQPADHAFRSRIPDTGDGADPRHGWKRRASGRRGPDAVFQREQAHLFRSRGKILFSLPPQ